MVCERSTMLYQNMRRYAGVPTRPPRSTKHHSKPNGQLGGGGVEVAVEAVDRTTLELQLADEDYDDDDASSTTTNASEQTSPRMCMLSIFDRFYLLTETFEQLATLLPPHESE
jgi:hypothetical protein